MRDDGRLALRLLAVAFCVAVFGVSWWRWWTFQYGTFDLAFYVQALWLALRGEFHVSLLDVPLMGNHAEPIVFLLLPLYAVIRHPMLLVAVQTLALATMPFSAYRIGRNLKLDPACNLLLAACTLIAPTAGYAGLHEFHPETFSAPLLLAMFAARTSGALRWHWVAFLGVLSCKENMAPLLGAYALLFAWRERGQDRVWQWRWNLAPMLVAGLWLVICSRVLMPWLNGGKVDYFALYNHLGETPAEMLRGFFTEPQRVWNHVWRSATSGTLVSATLLPFLFLPLLRPGWWIVALPILAQHLLSWRSSEWRIDLHYGAPLLPLAWMAAAEVVGRLKRQRPLVIGCFVACLAAQWWYGPVVRVPDLIGDVTALKEARAIKAKVVGMIKPESTVTAGIPYLSHLAERRTLISLHHILKGLQTLSRERFIPPPVTDMVLIDYADTETFNKEAGYFHPALKGADGRLLPPSEQLLHEYLSGKPTWWSYQIDSVSLLIDGDFGWQQPPPVRLKEPVEFPGSARLVNVFMQGSSTMFLEWETFARRTSFPFVTLAYVDAKGSHHVPLGLMVPWGRGGYVRQKISLSQGIDPNAKVFFIVRDLWNPNSEILTIPLGRARDLLEQEF